jgi:hypothetical protein
VTPTGGSRAASRLVDRPVGLSALTNKARAKFVRRASRPQHGAGRSCVDSRGAALRSQPHRRYNRMTAEDARTSLRGRVGRRQANGPLFRKHVALLVAAGGGRAALFLADLADLDVAAGRQLSGVHRSCCHVVATAARDPGAPMRPTRGVPRLTTSPGRRVLPDWESQLRWKKEPKPSSRQTLPLGWRVTKPPRGWLFSTVTNSVR